jgi:hypothetical protein
MSTFMYYLIALFTSSISLIVLESIYQIANSYNCHKIELLMLPYQINHLINNNYFRNHLIMFLTWSLQLARKHWVLLVLRLELRRGGAKIVVVRHGDSIYGSNICDSYAMYDRFR